MPAESERLRRGIGVRDRWFLGLVAVATLVGLVIAVLLSRHGPDAGKDANCVVFSHPNFTGGATYRFCGADAVAFCRRPTRVDEKIVAQCRQLGLRVGS